MSARLTPRQAHILDFMRAHEAENAAPLSGYAMAEALWETGAFTALEQGQRTCRQLEEKGMIASAGMTPTGAQCWVTKKRREEWYAHNSQRRAAEFAQIAQEFRDADELGAASRAQKSAAWFAKEARGMVRKLETTK